MKRPILFLALLYIISPQIILTFSEADHFLAHHDPCDAVCRDLSENDKEPVCMMFSRYKKGYQFFVNMCHARRVICRDKLVLQMVHPARCIKSGQFFMSID